MFKLPPQLDLEGFSYYTPSDELVRKSFIKITAPIPPARRWAKKAPLRLMRWKVYMIGRSVDTVMKGVCAGGGYLELIEAAVEALKRLAERKDQSYACFYGLVNHRGRPLYRSSREEIAHEIYDDPKWPSYTNCSCSKCSPASQIILPPITTQAPSSLPIPMRAVPLRAQPQDALQSINSTILPPIKKE